MIRTLIWLLAGCCVALSAYYSLTGGAVTAGMVVIYLAAVLLLGCGVFYRPLAAFTAHGVGLWLKCLALAGVGAYLALAVFLAVAGGGSAAVGDEQALVVLGAGLRGDVISRVLRYRLDAAYEFAVAHPDLPVVVTGGQGPGETRTEAAAMREYLLEKGLPPQRVLLEDRSTSTQENLSFALQVLAANGYPDVRTLAVVTNRFHCYRARLIAARQGLVAHTVAAGINWAAVPSCYAREVLATLYYWLLCRGSTIAFDGP